MASIKFFLQSKTNPANIYVRLSLYRGKDLKRKTGYFINPENWSKSDNLPKDKDADMKNLRVTLMELSAAIYKRTNAAISEGLEITSDWLQDAIDDIQGKKKEDTREVLVNYIQHYIDNLPFKEFNNGRRGASSGTMKKYITVKNKIEEFEKYKKKHYKIKDVDINFRNELVKYFQNIQKLNANTTGQYIKALKTVLNDAEKSGMETNRQLSQIRGFREKSEKIYLTFEELEKIEATTYTREALENAKDWLIIGCYIGQRVGDLLNLTDENIVVRAGLSLIELQQEKTKKHVSIPISDKVRKILDKRGGKFPYEISDQRFNEYIKDVCRLAGIDEVVSGGRMTYNEKDKFWRKKKDTYQKWELITSHVCRRSFASNFYGEIPTALLISITAHSTERQFLEYIGKTTNDYALQLAEYFRQMEKKAIKEPQLTVIRAAK